MKIPILSVMFNSTFDRNIPTPTRQPLKPLPKNCCYHCEYANIHNDFKGKCRKHILKVNIRNCCNDFKVINNHNEDLKTKINFR